MSLRIKGIRHVLAVVLPLLTEAVTPGDEVEYSLFCTSRKATVKTCTVIESDA